ncbi:DUF3501 family protein [Rhodospirillaceae bacterium KN72]|uniref:DUF3501 family protein n=2 Tax=Pacificispira spongiicola TaxID=2729598 RepID=A0A7Y0E164_9PROT|nr:DUF3501 family protein [Pacificispira spongiicola]
MEAMSKRAITKADILPLDEYIKVRKQRHADLIAQKKLRRIEIGPVATCYFENYDTMLHQVQEMLYIEKGGDEQIADELRAYNPMIPNGTELTATVMFEIDDPIRRKNFLSRLGGVEETMYFRFAGHEVMGKPEEDVDRTNADGKASSVQFIHFPFTAEQIAAFKSADQVMVGFKHDAYGHIAVLSDASRDALAADFD